MVLALKDKWVWDFWFAQNGDEWHVYFLQADKTLPHHDDRHRNVTQAHAVSKDLINWTHLGQCLAPSRGPAFDDWTTWTGSTLQGPDGVWHLFYTGSTHQDDGLRQRIGHATSMDMHSWVRVGKDGLCLDISGPDYEEYTPGLWHDRAMRDPWVLKDPEGDGWIMYFTARVPGFAEPNAGGSIGFATSPDLYTWTIQPPVFRGGMFGQMEVPQVFEHGGRWYCMFCTSGFQWSEAYRKFNPQDPVTGTHYLIADHPRGPWTVAPGTFFDGAMPPNRYSGKVIKKDGKLYTMGFVDAPDGKNFVGEVCDPIPVTVGSDGLLTVHANDK
jgi:beta-fructofuranosidase